jgi:uncharacterized protein YndB with AHSA1/START domain
MTNSATAGAPAGRRERVTIERTYQASIEDVWEMWTTKDGIEAWWGPEGFAVAVRAIDLRAGGALDYTMRATDAGQIDFMKRANMPVAIDHRLTYTEVAPPKRLAFSHYADFIPGVEPYQVNHTVELHATADGVRVTVTIDRMHDDYWTEMAVKGWTSELEKLAKALAA